MSSVATALDTLRAKFVRRLFAKYRSSLGRDEAEEIFVTGIAHAWACRAAFDPAKGQLEAWLWLNVKQSATEELRTPWCQERSRERRQTVEKLVLFAQAPHAVAEAEESVILTNTDRNLVSVAMVSLSEVEREILWADASSRDGRAASSTLAGELGMPESTIRSHRARGRRKLKRALIKLGFRPPNSRGGGHTPMARLRASLPIRGPQPLQKSLQRPAHNYS